MRYVSLRGRLDGRAVDSWLDVSSYSSSWGRALSPFILGPLTLPDGRVARVMENAWQYSKVYADHWDAVARSPNADWYEWMSAGFDDPRPRRFPRGRGKKPEGAWWQGRLLDYLHARRLIYVPLYVQSVLETDAWWLLQEWYASTAEPVLWEPDGRDLAGRSLLDAAVDTTWPFGHGAVLALMLQHQPDWSDMLAAWDARLG